MHDSNQNNQSPYFSPYKYKKTDYIKTFISLSVWTFICQLTAFKVGGETAQGLAYVFSIGPIVGYLIHIYNESSISKIPDQVLVRLMNTKDHALTNTFKYILKEYGYVPTAHLKKIESRINERNLELSRSILEKKVSNQNDTELLQQSEIMEDSMYLLRNL